MTLRDSSAKTIQIDRAADRRECAWESLTDNPAILSEDKPPFMGASPAIRELHSLVSHVGWSQAPVLIQGEAGVGKEVLARHLHQISPRASKPFFKLNCATLLVEQVESELFGYERGLFTGALQRKPGMFELAKGGTLMLDEIENMDYRLQAKVLQVLQEQEFQRLGSKETARVDVRIIAATHSDLETSILEQRFNADLYYSLNLIHLRVPALRERQEDILSLAEVFLQKHAAPEVPPPGLTPHLRHMLLSYNWPGNVWELENLMRKFVVMGTPDIIIRDLQARMARQPAASLPMLKPAAPVELSGAGAPTLEQVAVAKHQAETEAILAALNSTHWHRKSAAALLKINYKVLLYKMKKLGIEDEVAMFSTGARYRVDRQVALPEFAASA